MKLTLLFLWPLATCLAIPKLDGAARPPQYDAEVDEGTHGYYPVRKFTTTKLTAPHVNFLQWSPDCDDGRHYFIAPRGWSVSKPGPMILDGNGTMIWSEHFANEFGGQAYDLRVQKYHGEDYLTFWLGDDRVRGHGAGHYYMVRQKSCHLRSFGRVDEVSLTSEYPASCQRGCRVASEFICKQDCDILADTGIAQCLIRHCT